MNYLLDQHWHPVLLSARLKKKPLLVEVCGEKILVFRDRDKIAVIANQCPHRSTPLSEGKLINGRIICPYHGWSYDLSGEGHIPSGARASVCAKTFAVKEYEKLIWIKRIGPENDFLFHRPDGQHLIFAGSAALAAPLEIALDNMLDVEHASVLHRLFKFYQPQPVKPFEFLCERNENSVSTKVVAPRQKLAIHLLRLMGKKWGELA